MNLIKLIGGIIAFPFLLALFYVVIWCDNAKAKWLKFYYTKRGIEFYVSRSKFSDLVVRRKI